MAAAVVTVSLVPSVPSAKVGDPITFTYAVTGAGPEVTVVTGAIIVDGVEVPATCTLEVTHVVTAKPVTGAHLTNIAPAGPLAYTATVV